MAGLWDFGFGVEDEQDNTSEEMAAVILQNTSLVSDNTRLKNEIEELKTMLDDKEAKLQRAQWLLRERERNKVECVRVLELAISTLNLDERHVSIPTRVRPAPQRQSHEENSHADEPPQDDELQGIDRSAGTELRQHLTRMRQRIDAPGVSSHTNPAAVETETETEAKTAGEEMGTGGARNE